MWNLIWNDGAAANIPDANGTRYIDHPCDAATRATLPYRYRAAFDRSRGWTEKTTCLNGPVLATYRALVMRSGRIVVLYAMRA